MVFEALFCPKINYLFDLFAPVAYFQLVKKSESHKFIASKVLASHTVAKKSIFAED